jgi:hypothetical protein
MEGKLLATKTINNDTYYVYGCIVKKKHQSPYLSITHERYNDDELVSFGFCGKNIQNIVVSLCDIYKYHGRNIKDGRPLYIMQKIRMYENDTNIFKNYMEVSYIKEFPNNLEIDYQDTLYLIKNINNKEDLQLYIKEHKLDIMWENNITRILDKYKLPTIIE